MLIRTKVGAALNEEIVRALAKLETLDPNSEEYGAVVDRISKLHKLKTEEGLRPPSMDTVLAVSANVLGIIWITAVERDTAVTSKALGFVLRPR